MLNELDRIAVLFILAGLFVDNDRQNVALLAASVFTVVSGLSRLLGWLRSKS